MQEKRSRPVVGPLAGYEAGYRAELVRRGYKPKTVTTLIGLMRRFSCWMESSGYAVGDLSSAVAEEFLAEVRATGAGSSRRWRRWVLSSSTCAASMLFQPSWLRLQRLRST